MWGMWGAIVLMFGSLVVAVISGHFKSKGGHKVEAVAFFIAASVLGHWSVSQSNLAGARELKILGEGSYYEVVATTPVPGDRTLVHAIDLDGNKEKLDKLVNYPITGYKIEKVGKRTFLLPVGTRVAFDKEGSIIFISEEGEAVNIPPFVISGK